MAKSAPQIDILVLGDHPCAYLAAALLAQEKKLAVGHAVIPGEKTVDRLVVINPALYELHDLLKSLKRKLDLTSIYGLRFIADEPDVKMAHVGKTISSHVGLFKQVHAALAKLAKDAGVTLLTPRELEISRLDESGVDVRINKMQLHPKLLVLAGELPPEQKRLLGLPVSWEETAIRRYTFLRLKGAGGHEAGAKAAIVMSLNLRQTHQWAWLLPGPGFVQLAVEQSIPSAREVSPSRMLEHWITVLQAHGALKPGKIDFSHAISMDLPLAGALHTEAVANRTLCIGPAGGFYTACAEDIYPTCWSAVAAAETARKAIRERHVQDALAAYRQQWGATLGDYLRGPQQNLRFLLPLVYRNPTMAARLTEAILLGKSVVR
jgi:hypothetical protein